MTDRARELLHDAMELPLPERDEHVTSVDAHAINVAPPSVACPGCSGAASHEPGGSIRSS